jgi:hypothetical protein
MIDILDVEEAIVSKIKVVKVTVSFRKDKKKYVAVINTTCKRSDTKVGTMYLNEFSHEFINLNELPVLTDVDVRYFKDIASDCAKF